MGQMNRPSNLRSRAGRLTVLVAAAAVLSVRPSSASCAPAEITVDKTKVGAGDRLVISGMGWTSSCPEPQEQGCGADGRPTASPLEDIRAVLVPQPNTADDQFELGTADADHDYEFRLDAEIPLGTPPGRYRLDVSAGEHTAEAPITVVVE